MSGMAKAVLVERGEVLIKSILSSITMYFISLSFRFPNEPSEYRDKLRKWIKWYTHNKILYLDK